MFNFDFIYILISINANKFVYNPSVSILFLILISHFREKDESKENEEKSGECLDDVQVLTDFRLQGEELPKLSIHLSGGIFQGL
jgi:hypothetical protein